MAHGPVLAQAAQLPPLWFQTLQVMVPVLASFGAAAVGICATYLASRTSIRTSRISARTSIEQAALTAREGQKNIRASVLLASHQRWLDDFRTNLSCLLTLGERCYGEERSALVPICGDGDGAEVRRVSKVLQVLLGTEEGVQADLALLVGSYADAPTRAGERQIQLTGQLVFRERWEKMKQLQL